MEGFQNEAVMLRKKLAHVQRVHKQQQAQQAQMLHQAQLQRQRAASAGRVGQAGQGQRESSATATPMHTMHTTTTGTTHTHRKSVSSISSSSGIAKAGHRPASAPKQRHATISTAALAATAAPQGRTVVPAARNRVGAGAAPKAAVGRPRSAF
jgi:hypothetical protein